MTLSKSAKKKEKKRKLVRRHMYRGARQQTLNMRRTELAFLLHVINRSKNRTRE
jgi:hypothetical protein